MRRLGCDFVSIPCAVLRPASLRSTRRIRVHPDFAKALDTANPMPGLIRQPVFDSKQLQAGVCRLRCIPDAAPVTRATPGKSVFVAMLKVT